MGDRKKLNVELGRASVEEYLSLPSSGIAVVLDNVRSAHNVGSALRSSDSFRVGLMCLCGICATPPSAEIHKAALGAEDSVPWKHFDKTADAVRSLRESGYTIVAVEQTVGAVSLEKFRPDPAAKYALVFGNEVTGVAQDIVDMADFAVEIPQFGTKHSLNVSVSVGILLWHFCPFTR